MENDSNNIDAIHEQNRLLRQNLEISQEILNKTNWVKSYLKWQKVMNLVKIFIFVIPIIIGLIYLPPLLQGYLEQLSTFYK